MTNIIKMFRGEQRAVLLEEGVPMLQIDSGGPINVDPSIAITTVGDGIFRAEWQLGNETKGAQFQIVTIDP